MITLYSTDHPVTPRIQTRQQLEAVVENIVQLQAEWDSLQTRQEQEIAAVRQRYQAPLAEIERFLRLEMSWAEAWVRMNPSMLLPGCLLPCPHATIGLRVSPPRVDRASRKWTWTAIAARLGEVAWGQAYLRVPPPEADKEALLADRARWTAAELREVGLKIVNDDRFYVEPHGASSPPVLQEAA